MTKALIITPMDPGQAEMDHILRLQQMVELYRRTHTQVDLLFCMGAQKLLPLCRPLIDGVDQIAMSARTETQVDAIEPHAIHRLMAELSASSAPYRVAHLDQLTLPRRIDLAERWVVDHHDRQIENVQDALEYDLHVAASHEILTTLPVEEKKHLPAAAAARDATGIGTMIGWCGRWSDDLCQGWSEILSAIAERGQKPGAGLLLAGEGADRVEVPGVLAPNVLIKTAPEPSAWHALSLAVFPASDTSGASAAIAMLTDRRVPTLLPPEAAHNFGSFWSVPTIPGKWECADLLRDWQDPQQRDAILNAVDQTAAALKTEVETKAAEILDVLSA